MDEIKHINQRDSSKTGMCSTNDRIAVPGQRRRQLGPETFK